MDIQMSGIGDRLTKAEGPPGDAVELGPSLERLRTFLENTDGATALDSVKKSPPDLILLDVMMPGMDGFEVCRRLKADPISRDIPVIFLTAMNEDTNEAHGLELGAVDYITKPFNPAIVKARVCNHLETTVLIATSFSRDKHVAPMAVVAEARVLRVRLDLDDLSLSEGQTAGFFKIESPARPASAAEPLELERATTAR